MSDSVSSPGQRNREVCSRRGLEVKVDYLEMVFCWQEEQRVLAQPVQARHVCGSG